MKNMSITELYEKLCSEEFKNTENDIYYNFYIFQYEPSQEYAIRRQIKEFKANLIRPVNYVDVLLLDIFQEFCHFLEDQSFGEYDNYKSYLEQEEVENPQAIQEILTEEANSEDFYRYLHEKIMEHISIEDDKLRPYVFMSGIGSIYPYLRTSTLLTNYEKYNQTNRYKIIVFYPGRSEGNAFSLFNKINDKHTYRANILLNE